MSQDEVVDNVIQFPGKVEQPAVNNCDCGEKCTCEDDLEIDTPEDLADAAAAASNAPPPTPEASVEAPTPPSDTKKINPLEELKKTQKTAAEGLQKILQKYPLSKKDVAIALRQFAVLHGCLERYLNLLVQDFFRLVQGIEEDKHNLFILANQVATLNTVLLEKNVISQDEMQNAYIKCMEESKRTIQETIEKVTKEQTEAPVAPQPVENLPQIVPDKQEFVPQTSADLPESAVNQLV